MGGTRAAGCVRVCVCGGGGGGDGWAVGGTPMGDGERRAGDCGALVRAATPEGAHRPTLPHPRDDCRVASQVAALTSKLSSAESHAAAAMAETASVQAALRHSKAEVRALGEELAALRAPGTAEHSTPVRKSGIPRGAGGGWR